MAEETVAAVEALLAELEAEDQERHVTMAFLRKRLGQPAEGDGSLPTGPGPVAPFVGPTREQSVPGRIRSDEFFRMSIREAVRRYLNIMKSPQGPKTIMEALMAGGLLTESKNFYTTLWTALKRMEADQELVNTRTGWGLADWYPSRPKPDDAKKGKKKKKAAKKESAETTPREKKPPSEYQKFLGDAMAHGKSMIEAAAAWKAKKAAG
ncbi:MAG TPA: hypothetical protein VGQ48_02500 [Gemmatimonadales bacterium]|jgi:hypothetical protein|nr:hypothetical protein [Gemmatimonadales bacterium]